MMKVEALKVAAIKLKVKLLKLYLALSRIF